MNDLDDNVVNFFRVLRDRPDELIHKIQLTPWARAEYELSLKPCEDEVERARRFFVRSYMSFNGAAGDNPASFGWRHTSDRRKREPASYDLVNNALDEVARRLVGVQIENSDYADVIGRLDNDAALIYLDPPYVSEKRTHGKDWYLHDWDDGQHIEAARLLRRCTGYVVISGYACDLYADLYESHGWRRFDKESQTNSGGKRIESVWLSPRTWRALEAGAGLPLFDAAGEQE